MISGDNIYTAVECAKRAGILPENYDRIDSSECMLGKEFMERIGGVIKNVDKDGKEKYEIQNK